MGEEKSKESGKELSVTPEEALADYRQDCKDRLAKSEAAFETQLSFISSGALGVTVLLIEKLFADFSQTKLKILLMLGLTGLVICLGCNLYSHIVAANNKRKAIEEIDLNRYNYKTDDKRREWLTFVNGSSVISMLAGIILILSFIYINLIFMPAIQLPNTHPDYTEKGQQGQRGPRIEQIPQNTPPSQPTQTPAQQPQQPAPTPKRD